MEKKVSSDKTLVVKQLLDRDKIFTKELDPKKTKSSKTLEYEQNIKGIFVVDQNTNLENKRRLISLYTTHTTQKDFTDVVDIEFAEFIDEAVTVPAVDNTQVEDLSAENLTLKRKIDQLNTQVSQLETNIKNYPVVVNQIVAAKPDPAQQISDTLSIGATIYSDRTGEPGAPAAPIIQNMLLSKNRKARLIIQGDGNLIITTGEFNEKGVQLGPVEVVLAFGWDGEETAPAFFTVAWNSNEKKECYIALGGLYPYYQHRWRTDFFKTGPQTKLVLDDFGNINLFDKERLVWSSYGIDPNQYFVDYQRPILLKNGSKGPGYNDAYKATLKSKVDTITDELLATANSYRPASYQDVKNDVKARLELRRKLPYTDSKAILIFEDDIIPTINASVTQTVLNQFTYKKPETGPVSSPFNIPNGTYISSLKNNLTVTDITGAPRVVYASPTPKQIEITWRQIASPGTSSDFVKIYITGSVQASSSYAYAPFKIADWTSVNPLTPGIANVPYISAYVSPANNFLNEGQILNQNQPLISTNNQYQVRVTGQGNLIIIDGSAIVWTSPAIFGPAFKPPGPYKLNLKNTGELVISNIAEKVVWSSNTSRGTAGGPYTLTILNDRNLVVAGKNGTIWSSNTSIPIPLQNIPPANPTGPTTSTSLLGLGVTPGTYLATLVNASTQFKQAGTNTTVTVLDKKKFLGSFLGGTKEILLITIKTNGTVTFTPKQTQIQDYPNSFTVEGPFNSGQWTIQAKV